MAIALLAKLRSLHTAAIQYPYIVITLPRIIAISSHTYVSRTIRLEPALTYLSSLSGASQSSGSLSGASPQSSGSLSGVSPQSSGSLSGVSPQSSGGLSGASPQSSGSLSGASPQLSASLSGVSPQLSGSLSGVSPQSSGSLVRLLSCHAGSLSGTSGGMSDSSTCQRSPTFTSEQLDRFKIHWVIMCMKTLTMSNGLN